MNLIVKHKIECAGLLKQYCTENKQQRMKKKSYN